MEETPEEYGDEEDSEYDDEEEEEEEEEMIDSRHHVEFAKKHMQKIEEDMHRMHERHERLTREMDENYKLIEQEAQDYYIEFLQKWKEVAKSKISQYRKAVDNLAQEKEQIQRSKDDEIQQLKT